MDELTRLAHAARLGEAGALEAFVEASYDQVRRFCAAFAGPAAADDLAQETYVRCMRGLRRFRGDASARTWLLSVARYVCLDELRSRGRRNAAAALAGDPAGRVVPDVAEEAAVADLFARLDPDRRAAFVLTQVFRMPYQEAAVVCGCPVGVVLAVFLLGYVVWTADRLTAGQAAGGCAGAGPAAGGLLPDRGVPHHGLHADHHAVAGQALAGRGQPEEPYWIGTCSDWDLAHPADPVAHAQSVNVVPAAASASTRPAGPTASV